MKAYAWILVPLVPALLLVLLHKLGKAPAPAEVSDDEEEEDDVPPGGHF